MKESPVIRDVLRKYYEASGKGDMGVLEQLVSQEEGVLVIGTDPNEWWDDPVVLKRAAQQQIEARGEVRITPSEVKAYEEGSVGWAMDRPTITLGDGSQFQFRATFVLHQEGGEWKVVHSHISFGVPNP